MSASESRARAHAERKALGITKEEQLRRYNAGLPASRSI